ncbi:MAG: glycosyltransferase family protein [Methanopyraceae archaeon]
MRGMIRAWWVALLAALMGAGPVLVEPLFPRDAPAHAFGAEYARLILEGRAPADVCPYWYLGFPYTTLYCFLPYYLIAPLSGVVGGERAFAVGLVLAAWVFCLGVYALARSLGFGRRARWACVLSAAGMSFEWILGGIYPMTLSLGFGLLALAYRERRVLAPALLALSLYSHPLGGALSSLVMLLWGALAGRWSWVGSVAVAGLLAAPHYAFFLPYARWLSPLVDAPGSPLDLLRPNLYSPGLPLILLGGLGLWRARRAAWARVVAICWALAWGIALAHMAGWTEGLPFGRNLLVDRFTCALLTPLLSVAACRVLSGSPWVRALLAASVVTAALPWVEPFKSPVALVPGSKEAWGWVAAHRSGDPLSRVEAGPFFRSRSELYGSAHNAAWVGPRFTGNFAQGDPYFRALTERAEWELFWWEDPGFVRVVGWLGNVEYLVTALPSVAHAAQRAGWRVTHHPGHVWILKNPHPTPADAINPIAVYDPRPEGRERLMEYTTALNLVPRDGRRFAFVWVRDPGRLREFRKVVIRPRTEGDVRLAMELARRGGRVLLILPSEDEGISGLVGRRLGVRVRSAELRLRPSYPDVRDQVRVWRMAVRSRLKGPLRAPAAPKYQPLNSRPLPRQHRVDGGWFRDVRVGKGTIRVCGVDLPEVAARLHPPLLNTGPWIPPLPGPRERALFSEVLERFGSLPHPVKAWMRGDRVTVRAGGHRWVLVKVKHFPAWVARGGDIFVGPGGTMVIRADAPTVELRFSPPARLYWAGAVGFILGALWLALRARRPIKVRR